MSDMKYSSHAQLDISGRLPKAGKIRRLLPLPENTAEPLRVLEIGTGAGVVAFYFSQLRNPAFIVDAVDVADQRQVHEGFAFHAFNGRDLPFADDTFDIVISNHVIEHVGDAAAQAAHLAEIQRVLVPGGLGYLATPSRWQLVEPHFRLPFLGWLPKRLQDSYVRAAGRGEFYDCVLLRPVELRRLLQASGLDFDNANARALRALVDVEKPRSVLVRLLAGLPMTWLEALQSAFPVSIYLLRKPDPPGGDGA
jgi:SAM-dependent methyltransferase